MFPYRATTLILFLALCGSLAAQPATVSVYLQQIAKGWTSDAKKALPDLLIDRPDDPAVMFLHASLVDDPKRALPLYERIVERYPSSDLADDAMLRLIISACSAKDNPKAVKLFQQLRQLYPNSEVLTVAYDVMRMTVGVPPAETSANDARNALTTQPSATSAGTVSNLPTGATLAQTPSITTHPYTLAITTTPDKAEAESLVAKYKTKNLKVNMAEKWIKGKRNWVVQVGWYTTEVEAAADIDAVRKVCSCKPVAMKRMP